MLIDRVALTLLVEITVHIVIQAATTILTLFSSFQSELLILIGLANCRNA